MVQRTLLNLLRLLLLGTEHRWCEDPIESAPLLLGTEHRWCEDPIESAPFLLGPKPERRRALLFSSGFFFFFFFLSTIRAFLGGLTWSKTLENLHTHWNPRQLGRR